MSDRLAVFNAGRIEQIGTPAEVYERPATPFVAGFVGTSNLLSRRRSTASRGRVRERCASAATGSSLLAATGHRRRKSRSPIAVRPEKIRLQEPAEQPPPRALPRTRDDHRGRLPRHGHALRGRNRRGGKRRRTRAEPRHDVDGGARRPGESRAADVAAATHLRHRRRRRGNHETWRHHEDETRARRGARGGARADRIGDRRNDAGATASCGVTGKGEGTLKAVAWEGYGEPGVGQAVRDADRLQGVVQVRRQLGRDGDARCAPAAATTSCRRRATPRTG